MRRIEPSARARPPADFHEALEREIVVAETQRARAMAVLCLFLLALLGVFLFVPGAADAETRDRLRGRAWAFALPLAALAVYEACVRARYARLAATGRLPGRAFRWVHTFVETSIPSVILLATVHPSLPLQGLGGAPWAIYFLFVAVSTLSLSPRLTVFAGAVAAAEYALVAAVLVARAPAPAGPAVDADVRLASAHAVKSALLLASGLVAGFAARRIRRGIAAALASAQERDRAIGIFGQHVSPQVAAMLLEQPLDVAGSERDVCVMFLDVRDFSRFAADHAPGEVVAYLNALFGTTIPLVNRHRGIVNKFLGDGFMAVFGAPLDDTEPCANAVAAAHAMLAAVDGLCASGALPPTRIGIGLHRGRAVTGNVGSADRKEYTVIGDTVNLAARIEQATKAHGARLLASETVVAALGPAVRPLEDLGAVELKGQPRPTRLFRLA